MRRTMGTGRAPLAPSGFGIVFHLIHQICEHIAQGGQVCFPINPGEMHLVMAHHFLHRPFGHVSTGLCQADDLAAAIIRVRGAADQSAPFKFNQDLGRAA